MRGKLVISSPFSMRVRLIPAGAGKTRKACNTGKLKPAHPRRCGENYDATEDPAYADGSSPQVRGKLPNDRRHPLANRLIPAGAGKTGWIYRSFHRFPAHPRRCGENAIETCAPSLFAGSSPQVRGKRRRFFHRLHLHRLIPAGAGKTCSLAT